MKLHRPYIPLAVRVKVALRQIKMIHEPPMRLRQKDGAYLCTLLHLLFGDAKFALDHDPALVNRRSRLDTVNGGLVYSPPANDPDYLIYREAGGRGSDHDIKTRVRGDGAQLSDLAIARKRKRKERKKTLAVAPRFWSALHGKYLPGSKPEHAPPAPATPRWPPRGARWPKGRKIASRK